MTNEGDKLVDALLHNPEALHRLGKALKSDMQHDGQQSWFHRARPFLAGASSALVVLLAFLVPSLEEQWNSYKMQMAVDRYAEIGRALMRDGHYESAEQSFSRALELAGSQRLDLLEAQTKARVMRVYEDPAWQGTISDDLHESDFVYLLEIEDPTRKPDDRASTLTAYAVFLSTKNRLPEAEQALKDAIKLDPKAADPHIHLGNLYDDTGRAEAAEAEYRLAITLDAHEASAHYNLGLMLVASNRPALAEKEFLTYTRLQPSDAVGQVQLAQVQLAQNKRDAAVAAVETALRLDPQNQDAHKLAQSLHIARDREPPVRVLK